MSTTSSTAEKSIPNAILELSLAFKTDQLLRLFIISVLDKLLSVPAGTQTINLNNLSQTEIRPWYELQPNLSTTATLWVERTLDVVERKSFFVMVFFLSRNAYLSIYKSKCNNTKEM